MPCDAIYPPPLLPAIEQADLAAGLLILRSPHAPQIMRPDDRGDLRLVLEHLTLPSHEYDVTKHNQHWDRIQLVCISIALQTHTLTC